MFKIRYKSHHDVGNVISKFTKNFKASCLLTFTSSSSDIKSSLLALKFFVI